MIVCLCTGVTQEQFLHALEETQGDWIAASMETGAGMCCGGCRHFISQLSARAHTRSESEQGAVDPSPDISAT